MLKLYTDQTFLNEEHRKYVFPLLFDMHFLKKADINEYYNLVEDIAVCDIVVFPLDYNRFRLFDKAFSSLLNLSRTYSKPIWLYTAGDFGFTVFIPNSYNFRLGGFHSKLDDNTFIMPSFINDPYDKIAEKTFVAIKKSPKPTIGFVGHAHAGLVKLLKEYLNYLKLSFKRFFGKRPFDAQPFYPSSVKRAYYLNKLKSDHRLETNFIFRKKYKAKDRSLKDKTKITQEFYNNIFDNLYTFCSRGVGNFSVRFYETLASGRIPILLNTDCRLPLSDRIAWEDHCIILNEVEENKDEIQEQILKFHNAKSNQELADIQANNRLLWKDYLKRRNYFIHVHDIFISKNE